MLLGMHSFSNHFFFLSNGHRWQLRLCREANCCVGSARVFVSGRLLREPEEGWPSGVVGVILVDRQAQDHGASSVHSPSWASFTL